MEKKFLSPGIAASATFAATLRAEVELVPPTPESDAEFAEAINAMRSQDLECRQNMAGGMTVDPPPLCG